MAMVISDSFPCFYTLTDVQWKHINTCFIRHGNSQQHTDTLHETEYACHYLGLHLLTVMAIYIYVYSLQKYKSLWDIVNTYLCRQHSLYCIRKRGEQYAL